MRLPVNRTTVLLVLIGGLLAAGVFLLFTNEAASQLESVEADLASAEQRVDDLERRLAGEDPADTGDPEEGLSGEALQARADALDTALPDDLDTLDFEAQLPDLVADLGGEVSSLSRGETTAEGSAQHRPLSVSADLPAAALVDLLDEFRRQPRLMTVHDLSVSGFGAEEMSVSMEVRLWAVTDAALDSGGPAAPGEPGERPDGPPERPEPGEGPPEDRPEAGGPPDPESELDAELEDALDG